MILICLHIIRYIYDRCRLLSPLSAKRANSFRENSQKDDECGGVDSEEMAHTNWWKSNVFQLEKSTYKSWWNTERIMFSTQYHCLFLLCPPFGFVFPIKFFAILTRVSACCASAKIERFVHVIFKVTPVLSPFSNTVSNSILRVFVLWFHSPKWKPLLSTGYKG